MEPMTAPDLRGILAATVLPQTPDFEIDLPSLAAYCEWLLAEGVHGLAVNVDTGEGPHLAPAEALRVVETARTVARDRVPVIAGLGAASTTRAVLIARELRAAGADALLVFPSNAFRGLPLPASVPVDYYRTIGEEAGIPLVLFQLQEALGGVEFPVDVLVEIARLPSVVAIKEATFSRDRFVETEAALREVEITLLTGNDNFIYESFRQGAEGALIGFGTLASRMQVEMFEAHAAGRAGEAAALGERVQRLADVVFAPPIRNYRARLKEALVMIGVLPCAAIRPPLPPIGDEERETLRAALVEIGLMGGDA
jgi:4-hydroxy-tetrahydrodipicolinate synthase